MATLNEYFVKDFSRLLSIGGESEATHVLTGAKSKILVRIYFDFEACAKFVVIYCPTGIDPRGLVKFYADDISHALKIADSVEIGSGYANLGIETSSKELVFTGRLYVYGEETVSAADELAMRGYCASRDLKLSLRGPSYRDSRNAQERPAAFICHDSRDKKEVAEAIAIGLQKLLCPVWYDEYSLRVGSPLRESIEKGIKEATTCIVILSPNFFSNGGWTKAEFDSIYTREIHEESHLMLPVWHGVGKAEVYEYSPRLADRVGVSTSLGLDEVVRRLHAAIQAHQHRDNVMRVARPPGIEPGT